jgi:DNA-binding GntR family transcriptional regulator
VTLALKVPARAPLLRVERIAYTYNDIPVEYRVRYFDASRYHYRFDERGV